MNTKNPHAPSRVLPLLAAVLLAGCSGQYDRSAGRVIDDRGIAFKVRSNLNNSPVYKFPYVKVAAYNGTVQLSGFVSKDEQKNEAVELARRVPGVTDVINNISLAPPSIGGAGTRQAAGVTSGHDTNAPPPTPRTE